MAMRRLSRYLCLAKLFMYEMGNIITYDKSIHDKRTNKAA